MILNKKKNKFNIIDIGIICLSVILFLPCVQIYFPQAIRYLLLFTSFFCAIFSIIKGNNLRHFFGLFFATLLLSALFLLAKAGINDFGIRFIWMVEFWISLYFAMSIIYSKKEVCLITKVTVLILVLITSITTLIGNMKFSGASRILASGTNVDNDMFLSLNIGSYGFIYALVLLVPVFLNYLPKTKSFTLKILIVILVLFFLYTSLVTEFAIALLLIVFSSFLYLFFRIKNKKSKYVFLFVLLFVLLICVSLSSYIASSLFDFADFLSSRGFVSVSDRISSISNLISGEGFQDGTDAASRIDLYLKSLRAIINYPIIGTFPFGNYELLGGHSDLLDTIAGTGIVGVALLVVVFRSWFLKYQNSYGKKQFASNYAILIIIFTILSLINTIYSSFQLSFCFFLGPLIFSKKGDYCENC